MRYRITIRNDDVELRGYVDADDVRGLTPLAQAMKPFGVVIASPADDDYNPFARWDADFRAAQGFEETS